MNETELAELKPGDLVADPEGILQVLFNDGVNNKVTVSLLHSKEGVISYDELSDASKITISGGGGGGPSGDYVSKAGDTMTGSLALNIPQGNILQGNSILVFKDADGNWTDVLLFMLQYGAGIGINSGMMFMGATQDVTINPNSANIIIHGGYPNWLDLRGKPAAVEWSGNEGTVYISLDANGDLVATATAGPNAGKSVNLTKWAGGGSGSVGPWTAPSSIQGDASFQELDPIQYRIEPGGVVRLRGSFYQSGIATQISIQGLPIPENDTNGMFFALSGVDWDNDTYLTFQAVLNGSGSLTVRFIESGTVMPMMSITGVTYVTAQTSEALL